MKACPEEIVLYMHEYLDMDLSEDHEQVLKEHLQECSACQQHFQELKRTVAYINSTSHLKASSNFTANVMARLPKEKKITGFKRWLRHHPFLVAAALFMIMMSGTVFNGWTEDQKFSVTKQPELVVENGVVIVPAGKVVEGDVIVKNGDLRIEGEVKGNVTVINGERYLASAGHVTGEIEEIDELFEWIWFQMKSTGKKLITIFDGD